jgi:5-methylcytosine-specific restriction endonuclease McrA
MLLNAHVLVLNRSWVAVHVTHVRRAVTLVFQEQARIVDPEDFALYNFEEWAHLSMTKDGEWAGARFLHTPAFRFRVPEVILLNHFNGFVRREVRFTRRNIFLRDRHRCQYCGTRPARQELTIDHVVPKSRGGTDSWDNLVTACVTCNVRKGDRTPEEAGMHLLRRPGTPLWLPRLGTALRREEIVSWQRFVDVTCWQPQPAEVV